MQLKLEALQRVVKQTLKEEKGNVALRDALFKLFGPAVAVSSSIERIAEAANEQLDVYEATGRMPRFDDSELRLLLPATRSKIAEVRKIAARILPEGVIVRLVSDPSSSVRCAAAKRLPHKVVLEGVRRYPGDDQLRTISRAKRISEAGLPNPKPETEPFDLYGEEPMGDAAKTRKDLELTDGWYERLASKLCKEYGANLEGQWEEILASNVASSTYATTGVKIDRDRLLKCIYDCLEEREKKVLDEGSLSSIIGRLRKEAILEESLAAPAMPIIEEKNDPLDALLEAEISSSQYVELAEQIFRIRKSTVPAGIKKYRIGEGKLVETMIPVKGTIPQGTTTVKMERALDSYVKHWNGQQDMRGEPYRLSWNPRFDDVNLVGFSLELK